MDVEVKNFIGIVATLVLSIVVLILAGFVCWNLAEENTLKRRIQSETHNTEPCYWDYGTIKMERNNYE